MLRAGAILCGLGVLAGAFGAHGLASTLEASGHLETWHTAVRYQLVHGLALVLCALLARSGLRTGPVAWCLLLGTIFFSGSLYLLSLGGPSWLGPVTPAGGLLLLAGWLRLALSARPSRLAPPPT